jgi:NADH-quinone oxidoreductase subunit L
MITLVTSISFFVQVFSYYYMAKDSSRSRYFAFLSFFSFSMTGLVLSSNLLQTFIFWELVGLTSYLLIGFWIEKKSASDAARKAFVLNRLADLGFYLGIILVFLGLGTLNFLDIKPTLLHQTFSAPVLTALALLIFMGVMGKSALFPFHVWLPDAMEGPTPVSALIHSATMVAAGVFLLARNFALFSASETALTCILVIGTLTALVGALLATVQNDIKKILAYSTVSQLGLMTMAIGAGSASSGIFHLSTHAYFKSMLFLTSGAFIHRFHTNDIWEIGKKGGKTDVLALAMLTLGLFSLCGVFPFSGFFSKDLILETLKERGLFFYGAACLVSLLTVYYSCRMLFVILFSKITQAEHAHHESALLNACRALPLVSLFTISLYVGFLGTGLSHHAILVWLGAHETHFNLEIFLTTLGLIGAGAGAAFFRFKNPEKTLQSPIRNFLTVLLDKKFYMDDVYLFLVKQIGLRLAALLNWFDKAFVNGILVNQSSYGILGIGKLLSRVQNGLLQDYLSLGISAGVLAVFWLLYFHKGIL